MVISHHILYLSFLVVHGARRTAPIGTDVERPLDALVASFANLWQGPGMAIWLQQKYLSPNHDVQCSSLAQTGLSCKKCIVVGTIVSGCDSSTESATICG